ncbi:MAG: IS1 family transposase [Deltaproteobacteria bacterium CG12_big_fil_rev_8_21_14_0_65_43_10]|nr:MAG: IS1 family transposase [Deltaproteobacteria bacterium CG12_big_fil_rev_8_21_14_0_65_43_10]PIU84466.1 MAG: IS1 family transposase [Deltaproteobacteria bacterium CG06_land_8_20_14_3_00_44_19]PIZ19705.1 MAG: IS1 family transposase [Deltaproteobacteria bacterium CG_4_10_14_0_8_um_filter_43_12]
MVTCPKCGCGECKKDGIVKGRQRHKCKSCGYRHTVQHVGKSSTVKRQALELYLEGLGFRSIGRFLKCSHVAVYNWIKAFGKAADDIRSDKAIEVVEIDEMHSYISSKKFCWIWVAVDRYGKRFIDCVLGDRGIATGKQLWEAIQDIQIGKIATDYWKPYENFVPKDLHIQSKAETFTVEGYNSLFRNFLARMRRKSKCYSKSKEMLKYSVTLLMLKWNYGLEDILN